MSANFTVLLICTANECRSVYAQQKLTSPWWQVVGAGTEAEPGSPACGEVVAPSHSSRLLDRTVFQEVDLVLTMDKGHKSRAAEVSPGHRARMFTLSEAARLADSVLQALNGVKLEGTDFTSSLPKDWARQDVSARLNWLVAEMHEARSYLDSRVEDIADAHGENALAHAQVFALVDSAGERLRLSIAKVLASVRS